MKITNFPPVTNKQNNILQHLYNFRFLNTNHFQKLMNHKNPQGIQEWLKDLTQKGYIKQRYSKETFIDKMTPAIYSLTLLARRKLKANEKYEVKVLNRIYKEKTSSQRFINHNLLVADIYLILLEENGDRLRFFTQARLTNYSYLPKKRQLDAYIAIKESKKNTKRFFLKILDPGTPRYAIRALIDQYFEYKDNEDWKENTNDAPFPKILLVCTDENMKKFLFKYIKNRLEEENCDLSFFLTTREIIKSYQEVDQIWQKVK